ncbi:hypothetical protein [Streptomyces griseorubiginosus]|uniref:hypothetical protein n=1 Tax=Streptomyces griseorubiginosus TaxID=67304 RepID=UPI000AF18D69|nr:hypothetical protein [Streptomyces griseorubiginosus]
MLTDHYAGIVRSFDTAPVIVGHSVGGLIAQHARGQHRQGRRGHRTAPLDNTALPEAPAWVWTPDRADAEPLPRS